MTPQIKQEVIKMLIAIFENAIDIEESKPQKSNEQVPVEMLTIRECTQVISGLSEHAVRKLVAQEKIPYIRVGEGKRGKVLISKAALMEYLKITA